MDDKEEYINVRLISDLNGRSQIIPKEGKFVIEKAREEDTGNYTCNLGDTSYAFQVYGESPDPSLGVG